IGEGSFKKSGVETETKSKRMVVLKDFADVSDDLCNRTFNYPGYYMNKNFKYRICNDRTSFDNKGEDVMTHGGISLEEVIVPFVEIRRKING
ncbi:MAG: PglZ domain-containing protein, partial [Clostridia bacterium]|nr:PglZ domain-containing protein [Clostridia bacterium]